MCGFRCAPTGRAGWVLGGQSRKRAEIGLVVLHKKKEKNNEGKASSANYLIRIVLNSGSGEFLRIGNCRLVQRRRTRKQFNNILSEPK